MQIVVFRNIIRFVILVLVQVLVLDNIQFLGYINPYLYVFFILALPVRTPRWLSLVAAFILGLTIDAFSNTMGLHAFASVLIAFLRNPIIKLFTTIDEGANPEPSFVSLGAWVYIRYATVLVLIHHIALFFLESFSFVDVGFLLVKILLSTLVTLLLIFAIQLVKRH